MRIWTLSVVFLLAGCASPEFVTDIQSQDAIPAEDPEPAPLPPEPQELPPAPGTEPTKNESVQPWTWGQNGTALGLGYCDEETSMMTGSSSTRHDFRAPEGTKEVEVNLTWTGTPERVCLYLQMDRSDHWSPFMANGTLQGMHFTMPIDAGTWNVSVGFRGNGIMTYQVRIDGR